MTKTLILIRHSKTENRDSSLADFNRSLTDEGRSDSMKMGNFLLQSGIVPDLIVTSSAVRAYETSTILADVFKTDKENIIATRQLYYSTAKTILDQICGLNDTINCLMVVAHNPGISDLSRGLSSGKSSYMENTQVILIEFDIKNWFQIDGQKIISFRSLKPNEITL